MQNYEIALIINPDLSKDIDKFFTSFEKLLSDNNFIGVSDEFRCHR